MRISSAGSGDSQAETFTATRDCYLTACGGRSGKHSTPRVSFTHRRPQTTAPPSQTQDLRTPVWVSYQRLALKATAPPPGRLPGSLLATCSKCALAGLKQEAPFSRVPPRPDGAHLCPRPSSPAQLPACPSTVQGIHSTSWISEDTQTTTLRLPCSESCKGSARAVRETHSTFCPNSGRLLLSPARALLGPGSPFPDPEPQLFHASFLPRAHPLLGKCVSRHLPKKPLPGWPTQQRLPPHPSTLAGLCLHRPHLSIPRNLTPGYRLLQGRDRG